jgi:hypothetical protein
MDLVIPLRAVAQQSLRGGVPGGPWVWCRPRAGHCLRGGEPGREEQQLLRPMGWGLGRLAVLLVDHGLEKPFTF